MAATKHPDFIKYMHEIANHPNYKGMPDLLNAKGDIQWETPSNRASGQFQDSHQRRRDWWRQKALELGIDPNSHQWISKTAKLLHPTRQKPCSVCGNFMDIRYVYPTKSFITRVRKLPITPIDYFIAEHEDVFSVIERLIDEHGSVAIDLLPALFNTPGVRVPRLKTHEQWRKWLEEQFVPMEPRLLSPGAMSNAPDRLDGFHTHNRCCRPTADKGRNATNLRQYVTDRRVFEYWSEGDWVAADRLMGKIRTRLDKEPCKHGHSGPCAADHIGPISLGFCHNPLFQLLCPSCNGAKNNRMDFADVELLKSFEKRGVTVISWHSRALWDSRKGYVTSNETALRLSKQLRDNRHALMRALKAMADAGHYLFLIQLLELERANYDVDFENLRVENNITYFDREIRSARTTKYADEQKARRIRIAFEELVTYHSKENRNVFTTTNTDAERALNLALKIAADQRVCDLDGQVRQLLASPDSEAMIRAILSEIENIPKSTFVSARMALQSHMDLIGLAIAEKWKDRRYVRAEADEE